MTRRTTTIANVGAAENPLADLVFEGGGVKGIGLTGAHRELSDSGCQTSCVAGTSAVAITSLVASGSGGP